MKRIVAALQMLIFGAVGLQIRPSREYEKDRCRIANAYIQGGRIANPTEQIISSGSHWYYTPAHYNTFYRIK